MGRAAVRREASGPHAQRAAHPSPTSPGNVQVTAGGAHGEGRPAPVRLWFTVAPCSTRRTTSRFPPDAVGSRGMVSHPHHLGSSACPKAGPGQGLEGTQGRPSKAQRKTPRSLEGTMSAGAPPVLRSLASPWPRQAGLWGSLGTVRRRSWPERRGAVGILNHACSRDVNPSHHGGWAPELNPREETPGPPQNQQTLQES